VPTPCVKDGRYDVAVGAGRVVAVDNSTVDLIGFRSFDGSQTLESRQLTGTPMFAKPQPGWASSGWDDDELTRLAADARAVPEVTPVAGRHATGQHFAPLATTVPPAAEVCSPTDRSLHREPGGWSSSRSSGRAISNANLPVPVEAMVAVDAHRAERDARFGRQDPSTPLLRLTNGFSRPEAR
jgi:hypothetical protein